MQVRYQIANRIQKRFFPVRLSEIDDTPKILKIKLQDFPGEPKSHMDNSRFEFLNIGHDFGDSVDWNYTGHGKLWAYKLNYFEFLHQPDMDTESGLALIRDYIQKQHDSTEGLEPYPISLRGINWIKFMAAHQIWPDDIVASLNAQYKVLSKRIEYHLMGNHLLENGLSLLFAGVVFSDTGFLKQARSILNRELQEQVLPDGTHFELSPMYHCIMLQRLLDCYNLLRNNLHSEDALETRIRDASASMCGWLEQVRFSNGDIPMVNDSVHGEFPDPDELLRYAERLGVTTCKVALGESGYRMFRDGDFELFIDAGQIGPDYQPAHAHSDTLSFVLYANDKPAIIDRAVSTYEKSQIREEERGTASHNTVVLDGLEQSDVWGGFRVGRRANAEILEENGTTLRARHDGYKKKLGVLHYRTWKVAENSIEITDELKGGKYKRAEAQLHFHPDISVMRSENGEWVADGVKIRFRDALEQKKVKYAYATGFNRTSEADKLVITFNRSLVTEILRNDHEASQQQSINT